MLLLVGCPRPEGPTAPPQTQSRVQSQAQAQPQPGAPGPGRSVTHAVSIEDCGPDDGGAYLYVIATEPPGCGSPPEGALTFYLWGNFKQAEWTKGDRRGTVPVCGKRDPCPLDGAWLFRDGDQIRWQVETERGRATAQACPDEYAEEGCG